MAIGKDGAVSRQLRTLFRVGAIGELTDGQLLERFATDRGEAAELAFAAIVERHGSMVLRVCLGVLDDPHDAEDAFQGTFLVLVTKARGLWVRDSLGPWLHQVAYRTAICARSTAARRGRLDRNAAVDRSVDQAEVFDDLGRILHEEIDRLPEHFRAPLVLCDLEGRTHEQAARHLGWPVGTVKSRQARARDRLRGRLTRRGYAPEVGLLASWSRPEAPIAGRLLDSTIVNAVRAVVSRAIVPGPAAILAREVVRSMMIARWFKVASVLLALGAAGSGAGMLLAQDNNKPGNMKPAANAGVALAADTAVVRVEPGKLRFTVSEAGRVEPLHSKDVINEVEGSTVIIKIQPEGSRVQEGEIVAELDSAALRDQLMNQRIAVRQAETSFQSATLAREVAESTIKEYVDGILVQQRSILTSKIAHGEQAILKGIARLERTRLARKRFDNSIFLGRSSVTGSDILADLTINNLLDEAELSLESQKFDLELAKTELEVLEKFTREKMIKQLLNEVEQKKANEFSKRSNVELAKAVEAKLTRQVEKCSLRAPGDGVIVYGNNPAGTRGQAMIEEGATVRERQIIFRVINLDDPMRINAKVPEAIVDQIKPGLRARITLKAFPGVELPGAVLAVAPFPDPNQVNGPKVYTTLVKVENGQPGLRPGMIAQVEILIAEKANVLSVPVGSVVETVDKVQVAVQVAGGGIEWREVTLGMSNDKSVEVKKGLQAGDLVILNPTKPPRSQ